MFTTNQVVRVAQMLLVIVSLAFTSAASLASHAVPFQGNGDGHDLAVVPQADGIHILAEVEAQATHLGRFTERLDYVLSYDLVHFSGTGVFTSANGDELHVTFSGTIPGFSSGSFPTPYSSNFGVTGGTGRFQDASGGGVINGQDFGNGLFSATWTGLLEP
jgi:hypothetical protein